MEAGDWIYKSDDGDLLQDRMKGKIETGLGCERMDMRWRPNVGDVRQGLALVNGGHD